MVQLQRENKVENSMFFFGMGGKGKCHAPLREREREGVLYLYTATSKQVLRRGG